MEALNYDQLLKQFKSPVSEPTRSWKLLLVLMILFVLIGVVGLVYMVIHGHIVTGMRDHVVWGVFIVNFIFLLGIGYAGVILASIFHLFTVKWTKPLHRITELFAVVGSTVGPIYILLCVGRLERLPNLFIHARASSPITWDVIAIATCVVFDFTYLYITHIREFAKLRDTTAIDLPKWKRNLYKRLALGYEHRPAQNRKLSRAQNILAMTIVPVAIFAYSLLGYLFGMSLRPGWHSTLFAPEFVANALFSGVALLILFMWIYRKQHNLENLITDKHFDYAAFVLFVLSAIFAYFTFSTYITEWYNVTETHGEWIRKFLDFNEYGWMSMFTILFCVVLPFIVLLYRKFRTPGHLAVLSVLILIGLWLKRYLIIVPTLETPYFPMQSTDPAYVHYSATWVEWALTLGGIGLAGLIFMAFNYLAPVVPLADMEKEEEIEVPQPFVEPVN